jgi:UDP-galactopyranose mutase
MQQKYQYMPKTSFTELFKSMLEHKNITVETNVDALDFLDIDSDRFKIRFKGEEKPIIFTGPIDELFGSLYGPLPYRSLDIVFKTINQDFEQIVPLIAYPQGDEYIRSCEYKYLYKQEIPGVSTISYEYPLGYDSRAAKGNIPYYPIINGENRKLYMLYRQLADKFSNLYVCGRLGDYKYYNMDASIERAFEVFSLLKKTYL